MHSAPACGYLASRRRSAQRSGFKPLLEALEDRTLLSVVFRPLGTLDSPDPVSFGLGINNHGQIAGYSTVTDPDFYHAVLWNPDGTKQELPTLGGGTSLAFGVNNAGQVVGSSDFTFDPNQRDPFHPFLWDAVTGIRDLGTLGGSGTPGDAATAINDAGQVVGGADSGIVVGPYGAHLLHAFLWSATSGMQDLQTLGADSYAYGINNHGEVVGVWSDSDNLHGFIWDPVNKMRDLGSLNPAQPYTIARSINNFGEVVGESLDGAGHNHAFLWNKQQGMIDLGTLGGPRSSAFSINNAGDVVGYATASDGQSRPFVIFPQDTDGDGIPDTWYRDDNHDGRNDLMQDLNDAAQTGGWSSVDALNAINDQGQIAGTGIRANIRQAFAVNRIPVLILPGIAGTFPTDAEVHDWYLNRGIAPDALRIDPLAHTYDDLIQTLKNAGYVEGKDLFVANYDWRMPPGPNDGTADGQISGLNAQDVMNDVAAGHYYSGVDYLGYWLKKASNAWLANYGVPLDSVDVIAHSTGGLVARSYIQSDAYNGLYNGTNTLPKINNFIMLDVPNRGAAKAWNPQHDDWAGYVDYHLLAKVIDVAFQKVQNGLVIHGPDRDITLADITVYNTAGQPVVDKEKFISLYVPTIQTLLPTYDFLDTGSGVFTNINGDDNQKNWLALDLNGGSDPNAFTGMVAGQVIDIYGNGVMTPVTVTQRTRGGFNPDDPQFSITDFKEHPPAVGSVYYHNNLSAAGDGTVPLISMADPFSGDSRVTEEQFALGFNTTWDVSHTGIVSNPDVQQSILDDLGLNGGGIQISTGHGVDLTSLHNYLVLISDPVQAVLTDAEGRRLGFSQATGVLTEIPKSIYLGQADGIGFVFGPVTTPLTLNLSGLGENYFVEVSGEQGDTFASLSATGSLALGQQESLDVPFVSANRPPVLAAINNQTIDEGKQLTFTAQASDPDTGELLSFSLDSAPVGAAIDRTSGLFTWTPVDGPATVQVTVRVTDNASPPLSDTKTFTITVNNVPPSAGMTGPGDGVRGQPRTFTLSANDPSPVDQAAGFVFAIDWGDGTSQTVNGLSGTSVDHVFTSNGNYMVQVTATDKDGGVSDPATHSIAIAAAELQGTDLVVGGTTGDDDIRFRLDHDCDAVRVTINHKVVGTFHSVGRIIAYGQAGDDDIEIAGSIRLPAVLFGGPGNDRVKGGSGDNVLVGGDGCDLLIGGRGRDLLIGGAGSDMLIAGAGDDLLISGTTAFDDNLAALDAILAEWTSGRDYATHIANLSGIGTGPRANGDVFLVPGTTVFDDVAPDVLIGGSGEDWYFANFAGTGPLDVILGRRRNETVTDV